MKTLIPSLIIFMFAACSVVRPVTIITISGINTKTTLNKTMEYNVDVTGKNNEVSIARSNIVNQLHISGQNNNIIIESTAIVKNIDMFGENNKVYVPVGFQAHVINAGLKNSVIEK